MKLLKIYDRNKNSIANISNFDYGSLDENSINQIIVYENPEQYKETIIELIDHKQIKIGGIIKNYSWNPKTKEGIIYVYPLLFDLQQDFIQDELGNKVYYVSGKMEEILDDILTQYLARVSNPILSKGTFATTTKNVIFTFKYANLYEALQFLQNKMLVKGFYIKVDVDGKVNLVNITGIVDLFNEKDILEIDFTKIGSEKIKQIIFDNKKTIEDPDRILKTYNNPDVTIGSVKYISDSRFSDETSVDDYVQNIFDDSGEKIEVQSVISEIDVPLYSQINIYNWEKNFGDIYVISKQYLNDGKYNLKLGSKSQFKISTDEIASVENSIDETNANIVGLVPAYIQETYIDSVEVRSPTISGNNGLFSGLVKVGVSGITISGTDKSFFSANYNLTNKTGFKFKEDGTFLLGQNTSNFLQFDGINFNFSGKISASTGSSINFDYLTNVPDSATASYITSTKITATTIESPTITAGSITGGTITGGIFQTSSSGSRVAISGVNNRMSVFNSGGSEILNIGYNVSAYNNLMWGSVGSDGFTGPLIRLDSGRNSNVAYFETTNSSTNLPTIYAKSYDTTKVGLETNGRIVGSKLFTTTKIDTNGGIETYGSGTGDGKVGFYNQDKFYLRYSNTYLEVDGLGDLYWNGASGRVKLN